MDELLDLHYLATRENERTDWREPVANPSDVVRTLSAFANDLSNLGGGYVVCGVAEERDAHGFPTLRLVGLSAARLREVEGQVLTRCRERVSPAISPRVVELASDNPSTRVLVFIQPATGQSHTFREGDTGGKHQQSSLSHLAIEVLEALELKCRHKLRAGLLSDVSYKLKPFLSALRGGRICTPWRVSMRTQPA